MFGYFVSALLCSALPRLYKSLITPHRIPYEKSPPIEILAMAPMEDP
jgi:hypothetical protein